MLLLNNSNFCPGFLAISNGSCLMASIFKLPRFQLKQTNVQKLRIHGWDVNHGSLVLDTYISVSTNCILLFWNNTFLKMGHPRPLPCLFSSFQTNITTNKRENVHPVYGAEIRIHDLLVMSCKNTFFPSNKAKKSP